MNKLSNMVIVLYVTAAIAVSPTVSRAESSAEGGRFASLQRLADQGDANAQVMLGLYYGGMGPSTDYPKALSWFRKAAEQGNPTAEVNLGQSYEEGRGVTKDLSQAVFWYRKAAEQGDRSARQKLRRLFVRAEIRPTLDAYAGPWWKALVTQADSETQNFRRTRDSAERGGADAELELGLLYLTGIGTPADRTRAIDLFRVAAGKGQSEASCIVSTVAALDSDWKSTELNEHAASSCLQAANQGSADAQLILSTFYAMGRGVPRDKAQAVAWCRKAADQGRSDAQAFLAIKLSQGDGITKNEEEAVSWYQKAAAQGNPDAQFSLGLAIQVGRMTGHNVSHDESVDAQRLMDLGTEHAPEKQREFLVSLWASPAMKEKERQMAKELAPKLMPMVEEMNKKLIDSIYGPQDATK